MVRQFPLNMHSLRQQILPGVLGVLAVLLLLEGSEALNFQRGQLATLEDTRELLDDLQRDKRFPRLLTCNTDHDCRGLDRLSCCVKSEIGNFRMCKPLRSEGSQCNMHIQPHLWEGVRLGRTCPCMAGLRCKKTTSNPLVGNCLY